MKRENVVIGNWLLGAIVFVMLMFFGTTTALATRITSFSEAGNFSTGRDLGMNDGDNLLVRIGGVDMSVTEGTYVVGGVTHHYSEGSWHLGLTDDQGFVVGWATNSDKSWPGYEGWLAGRYSGSGKVYNGDGKLVYEGLVNGEKPIHAFLVYDSLVGVGGAGWDIVGGIAGSPQDLLDGDLFFDEMDIIFGADTGTGGVSNLSSYPLNGIAPLPEMTVVIPEPATLTILTLGALSLIRKRSK